MKNNPGGRSRDSRDSPCSGRAFAVAPSGWQDVRSRRTFEALAAHCHVVTWGVSHPISLKGSCGLGDWAQGGRGRVGRAKAAGPGRSGQLAGNPGFL